MPLVADGGGRSVPGKHRRLVGQRQELGRAGSSSSPAASRRAGRCARCCPGTACPRPARTARRRRWRRGRRPSPGCGPGCGRRSELRPASSSVAPSASVSTSPRLAERQARVHRGELGAHLADALERVGEHEPVLGVDPGGDVVAVAHRGHRPHVVEVAVGEQHRDRRQPALGAGPCAAAPRRPAPGRPPRTGRPPRARPRSSWSGRLPAGKPATSTSSSSSVGPPTQPSGPAPDRRSPHPASSSALTCPDSPGADFLGCRRADERAAPEGRQAQAGATDRAPRGAGPPPQAAADHRCRGRRVVVVIAGRRRGLPSPRGPRPRRPPRRPLPPPARCQYLARRAGVAAGAAPDANPARTGTVEVHPPDLPGRDPD